MCIYNVYLFTFYLHRDTVIYVRNKKSVRVHTINGQSLFGCGNANIQTYSHRNTTECR